MSFFPKKINKHTDYNLSLPFFQKISWLVFVWCSIEKGKFLDGRNLIVSKTCITPFVANKFAYNVPYGMKVMILIVQILSPSTPGIHQVSHLQQLRTTLLRKQRTQMVFPSWDPCTIHHQQPCMITCSWCLFWSTWPLYSDSSD